MKSRSKKPIAKVSVGLTVGSVVAFVGWIIVNVFHKNFTVQEAAALTGILGVGAHFLASYLTPYVPEIETIIAYVKKLLSEIPPADF